eukprot:TRINITY_DN1524_c0_g1_i3.p1 TRINITY_DN1524_c0_g1~~TRINITY_DN1524_c0_g1_i3.p1  ORF type:complete len:591 (-),score=175.26 TRINITY_DN1524_c0_g1_i3:41-1813(-)
MSENTPQKNVVFFKALTHCVSMLAKDILEFKELIECLWNFDWNSDEKVVDAYIAFMLNLVSANTQLSVPFLSMICNNFKPRFHMQKDGGAVDVYGLFTQDEIDADIEKVGQRFGKLRDACVQLFRIVPTALMALFPVMRKEFPPQQWSACYLSTYTKYILKFSESFSSVKEQIFDMIISKMLEVDACLLSALDRLDVLKKEAAAAEAETSKQQAFNRMLSGTEDPIVVQRDAARKEANLLGECMDDLMCCFLSFIDEQAGVKNSNNNNNNDNNGGDQDMDEDVETTTTNNRNKRIKSSSSSSNISAITDTSSSILSAAALKDSLAGFSSKTRDRLGELFGLVLNSYVKHVLKTPTAVHVPYLMIAICRFREEFSTAFVQRMLEIAENENEQISMRIWSCLTAAAFVAKMKNITWESTAYMKLMSGFSNLLELPKTILNKEAEAIAAKNLKITNKNEKRERKNADRVKENERIRERNTELMKMNLNPKNLAKKMKNEFEMLDMFDLIPEPTLPEPEHESFSIVYAAIESVMYVLCFHLPILPVPESESENCFPFIDDKMFSNPSYLDLKSKIEMYKDSLTVSYLEMGTFNL